MEAEGFYTQAAEGEEGEDAGGKDKGTLDFLAIFSKIFVQNRQNLINFVHFFKISNLIKHFIDLRQVKRTRARVIKKLTRRTKKPTRARKVIIIFVNLNFFFGRRK